jgi:hypothetical protein
MIPETSGASRRYIPMGFMRPDIIASNSVMTAEDAALYIQIVALPISTQCKYASVWFVFYTLYEP